MPLLYAELLKIARRGLVWWLAGAALGLTLLRGLVFPPSSGEPWPGLWSAGLVSAVLITVGAVTVGQELAEGTWRALAARGVARWRLFAAPWLALVLIGGVLLVGLEGAGVLLDIRHALAWAELLRAWLALWPIVSLTMLLAVLAGNAGLPLLLGLLQLLLDQAAGMVLGVMAMIPNLGGLLRIIGPDGVVAALYRWTMTFNGAVWTYLGQPLRMPAVAALVTMTGERPFRSAGLILLAYTVAGVGLSLLILYRRELVESTASLARPSWREGRLRRAPGAVTSSRWQAGRLAAVAGAGPLIIRLAYAQLVVMARTSLVRVGAISTLLFVLGLYAVARSTDKPDVVFRPLPGAAAPLALAASLVLVGLLAAVIAILAVTNELSFGTRRAALTRGVTRLQALVSQSLAILVVVAVLLAWVLVAVLAIGVLISGVLPAGRALLVLVAGLLVAATYVGAVQIGAALSRSPLGPMLLGLGWLLADWLAIIVPSMNMSAPSVAAARYTPTFLAYGLITGRPLIEHPGAAAPLAPVPTLALLCAAALLTHAVAAVVAYRRDA